MKQPNNSKKLFADRKSLSHTYEYEQDSDTSFEIEGESYPYVSLRKRRELAASAIQRFQSEGVTLEPVKVLDRKLAVNPWAIAWFKNIESWSDYASRLAPGRTYLRRGAVLHLKAVDGNMFALVQGSDLYEVRVQVVKISAEKLDQLRTFCTGRIGTVLSLFAGHLDGQVMAHLIGKGSGLFPDIDDVTFQCTCPDYARMCKHVAATLYGFGAKLDEHPELLFRLQGVDPATLVAEVTQSFVSEVSEAFENSWDQEELSKIFGIDFASEL